MKLVTITEAQPELLRLVEDACAGAQVVLAYGDKRLKLEPYAPRGEPVEFDLHEASAELEAELLKGIKSSFSPFSRNDLEALADRVRREKAGS